MEAFHNHEYFYYNNKKSGQIPAFGNWDYSNELPITQYFECARQAGLIRYSASSADNRPCVTRGELCAVDYHHKPARTAHPPSSRKATKRCPQVKEQKKHIPKQGGNLYNYNYNNYNNNNNKVHDVAEQPRKLVRTTPVSRPQTAAIVHRLPKPVDEDLYKIPPELLHASKRKKRLGIFSRCLVPCTS